MEAKKLKFIDLGEWNGKLFHDLGLDFVESGDSEKAIFYFSKAIELQPKNPGFYLSRGKSYWRTEKPSLAFLDWQRAKDFGSTEADGVYQKHLVTHEVRLSERSLQSKLLDEAGVFHLYHMTHMANLASILRHGLVSHNQAHADGLLRQDISEQTVNQRRVRYHDYVPLYFNPKNPMLFRRRNIQSEIVILCINREKIFEKDIRITDGNAASKSTIFYNSIKNFDKLDWNIIRSKYWNDFEEGKRKRCAEILIPQRVSVQEVQAIYCINEQVKQSIESLVKGFDICVVVNPAFYF